MVPNSTTEERMEQVVKDLSNRLLLERIEQILREPKTLLDTARDSYRHQLGFLKITLQRDVEGRALRLHIWDNNSITSDDVHSHCADFISRVISGELQEREFKLVSGDGFTRFSYRFDTQAGHALAHKEGTTDVLQTSERSLLAGTTYRRGANELHTTSALKNDTITVSAWGVRTSAAIVVKPIGASSEDCGAATGMRPDDVKILLMNIRERFHAIS